MAHTPGPWAISEESGCIIAPVETPLIHEHHYYGGELIAESIHREDDRRLIAAAPEMADVLQKLNLIYNTVNYPTSDLEKAETWSEVLKVIGKIKPAKQYITFPMAIQHLADGKKIACDYEKKTIIINPSNDGLVTSLNKGTHTVAGGAASLEIAYMNSRKWYVIEEGE
ncbi:hypothetical protein [Terribacillus halophilus]|uniref:hypothetical protein n=1 Tax=Terribacillus halophilus TaxID=361279 RepID=UPI003981CEE2